MSTFSGDFSQFYYVFVNISAKKARKYGLYIMIKFLKFFLFELHNELYFY